MSTSDAITPRYTGIMRPRNLVDKLLAIPVIAVLLSLLWVALEPDAGILLVMLFLSSIIWGPVFLVVYLFRTADLIRTISGGGIKKLGLNRFGVAVWICSTILVLLLLFMFALVALEGLQSKTGTI
jgi:hypothetical protein